MAKFNNKICLQLSILFFLSVGAEARMYQWTEPGTESTQLSGKPPAWYRSSAGGPRVFVFEDGRLIDDTGVEVSEELRQRLRQQAFVLAEEDRQAIKEKMVRAEEFKQKFKSDETEQETDELLDTMEGDAELEKLLSEDLASEDEEQDEGDNEKTLEEMRDLIADWERSQTENAKKALEE